MRGAGGTSGGSKSFVLGVLMASAGFYLLLQNIVVTHGPLFATTLYRFQMAGSFWNVPTGGLLIPLLAGIGWVFYDAKSVWGWLLAGGALAGLLLGVLMSLNIVLQQMSLLNLILILVLVAGGLGLFARSLRAT